MRTHFYHVASTYERFCDRRVVDIFVWLPPWSLTHKQREKNFAVMQSSFLSTSAIVQEATGR